MALQFNAYTYCLLNQDKSKLEFAPESKSYLDLLTGAFYFSTRHQLNWLIKFKNIKTYGEIRDLTSGFIIDESINFGHFDNHLTLFNTDTTNKVYEDYTVDPEHYIFYSIDRKSKAGSALVRQTRKEFREFALLLHLNPNAIDFNFINELKAQSEINKQFIDYLLAATSQYSDERRIQELRVKARTSNLSDLANNAAEKYMQKNVKELATHSFKIDVRKGVFDVTDLQAS